VQESWTRFKELLSNIMESTVPKKRQNRRARQSWITAKITRQVRRKRSWNTLKKHNTAENREKYNEVEKKTRNMIRNAKRKLEKNLANGPDKNNRKFARYIKLKTKSQMHHWTSAIS
jgi:CRISPR/Cas system CMR subunit Cmr6 (Cas7 group RAMP superfamily)